MAATAVGLFAAGLVGVAGATTTTEPSGTAADPVRDVVTVSVGEGARIFNRNTSLFGSTEPFLVQDPTEPALSLACTGTDGPFSTVEILDPGGDVVFSAGSPEVGGVGRFGEQSWRGGPWTVEHDLSGSPAGTYTVRTTIRNKVRSAHNVSPSGANGLPCTTGTPIGTEAFPNPPSNGYVPGPVVETTTFERQVVPAITWADPAPIVYGTPLSAVQLDPTATDPASGEPVEGSWSATPAAGALLGAGAHTLSVTFTPDDAVHYAPASAEVTLQVERALATVTADDQSISYGDDDPTFTWQATELVGDDQLAGVECGVPGPHDGAGTYDIVCAAPDDGANANYELTFEPGTLTVGRAAVRLVAPPALLEVRRAPALLGVRVHLLRPQARLVEDRTGALMPGEVVTFWAGGRVLCNGITDGNGVASCEAGVPGIVATLLAFGRDARYGGGDDHLPASGRGPLIDLFGLAIV